MSAAPKTPGLAGKIRADEEIKGIYDSLNGRWDLGLLQQGLDSPGNRKSRCKSSQQQLVDEIMFKIRYLYYKNLVYTLLESFNAQAQGLYSGWAYKPKADRGVVPEKTRQRPHPTTPHERMELLQCLASILNTEFESCQSRSATPSSRGFQQGISAKANASIRSIQNTHPDDSPVAFPFKSAQKPDGKRVLEPFPDIITNTKKTKAPENKSSGRESLSKLPPLHWNVSRPQNTKSALSKMVPLKGDATTKVDTSFTTDVSVVFSQGYSSTLVNTQSTAPDPDPEPEPVTKKLRTDPFSLDEQGPKTQSSDFGSSFDTTEADMAYAESLGAMAPSQDPPKYDIMDDLDDEMSDEMLDGIVDGSKHKDTESCLNEMLPTLPPCLKRAPFSVSYEITRVFLFVQVPISEFTSPYVKAWEEYDKLWNMLKGLPILQGKKFPERCPPKVWDIATKGYIRGFNGIVFTATLRENKTESGPLISFHLQPMKLDLTNRLERRFGSDRLIEFAVPDLGSRKRGSTAFKVDTNACDVLKSWLVNGDHQLLGRTYKAFYLTSGKRKRKSSLKSDAEEESSATPYRAFLFATDGNGFVKGSRARDPPPQVRVRMTVGEMLNYIRPTAENDHQPYMKLFARTALVLSRNRATVTVDRAHIRRKKDIRNPDVNDPKKTYVMTDGAGRLSLALARKIVFELELSYIPAAFQGRFGEAKGLWIVDRSEDIESDWIELYDEQCKWKRGEEGSPEFDHWSHRTFEVVGHSAPLKTADLNTQLLPLLVHQAKDPRAMRNAILNALKDGLKQSLEELKTALTSPQELRSWIPLTNSSVQDRIKNGAIQWRGGLPAKHEDRLSTLLDAGFDPRKLHYVMELARKAFDMKCEELKERLNITVAKSTKVYMVPDFWGVLEPNEVHLNFSSFVDNGSGLSDTQLENVDVLVARNPAHYPSDIQRVTAVSKHELRHLKDVIVFSTKGYPSLADKLSGGDYDGDIAWVCWDPAIVESFANADVPKAPDLVKEGFIGQDKRTYAQLTKGCSDPTNTFLCASFKFNMCQSMLGPCTAWKENIEYDIRDLDRPEITFLSTLLSNLVDQAKQGYIFTEKHFQKVKTHVLKTTRTPRLPAYKDKDEVPSKKDHILDHMMNVVHEETKALKTEFYDSVDTPPQYDPELAQFYIDQREKVKVLKKETATPEEIERAAHWKLLLDQLDEDVNKVKNNWINRMLSGQTPSKRFTRDEDETRADFAPIRDECFQEFRDIKPHADNKLISTWLDQDTEAEYGDWALLRASALYATYAPKPYFRNSAHVPKLVWWMAGRQFAMLKARRRGFVPVADHMYVMLKANVGFVRQLRAHEGMGMGMDYEMRLGGMDGDWDDGEFDDSVFDEVFEEV
ncbi:f97d1a8f-f65a-4b30-a5cc-8bf4ab972e43 [Sclerotinia trifoliorum]|uniref:RNA-dependent RNA polymerase n=1 Tax=Sclerotinia trifoliorum TaxID=28548 RepID=A0A8H2VSD4_9HELO|nr:f97d1a8f-f65a-4b30-a5cc-8bf4ab972e43 [Sclerotinia trifoliorum]